MLRTRWFDWPAAALAAALLCSLALPEPGYAVDLPGRPSGKSDAKPKGKGKGDAAADADKDKPYGEWKKVTKDTEVMKGLFTFHKKRENLYLELQPAQLGVPVLGVLSLGSGIGSNFVLGGMPMWIYTGREDRLIEFQREGDFVLVLEKNMRFLPSADEGFEKARHLSYGNSVLAKLKIESVHDSSKALLVDFAPFVVSDVSDMGEGLRNAINKPVRFEKDRSALSTVKVFPENVEIEALLTYVPNDRTNLNLPTVSDERFIPITMHYSFSKLPEIPMTPRIADERVGYFVNAYKDFSNDRAENFWVRYVNRWRLEKKDPTAAMSEPVKPIVFYIDHTIPKRYRGYVKEGVERWQKAYEAAGFKNAIIAKDAPADPDWDPEDVRYSTIRWITSSEPSFGAIGPSRTDPRTGEILDADILFEASIVQARLNAFRRVNDPQTLAEYATPWLTRFPPVARPERLCALSMGMQDGMGLLSVGHLLEGGLTPELEEKFVGEMLVHVVLHEVGHTLGLAHNFRSSTATPWASLHDRAWTNQHGLTASVMDYATPNIATNGGAQGEYYGVTAGTYDLWAIRYGYAPSGTTNLDADYAFARRIADESAQAGHEFSDDTDTYPADALDPRTNIWDLGNDPMRFAKDRAAYVSRLWKNPEFEKKLVGKDGTYPQLRRAVDGLLGQYAIALGMAVKQVGGQYHHRDRPGQPAQRFPLQPVPAAGQRDALDFIATRGFAVGAFDLPSGLLNRLGPDRWSHWGNPSGFGPQGLRLDYDLNDRVLAIQTALVNGLTQPRLLARLREAETRSADAFRMSELFDRLTRATWGDVGGTAAAMKALEGPHTRRELQRAYVDRMAVMLVSPPAGIPDDARALARLQLQRVDARAARVLGGEAPIGDYTRSHLLESRARIKRALDAGRDVQDRPAGGPGGPFGTP
ncbi:MAG: zinc-dependent metalloprotease [Candidatus Eisenbacteria bacterium]